MGALVDDHLIVFAGLGADLRGFAPVRAGLQRILNIFVLGQDTANAQVTLTGIGLKLKASNCSSSPESWIWLLALAPLWWRRRRRR